MNLYIVSNRLGVNIYNSQVKPFAMNPLSKGDVFLLNKNYFISNGNYLSIFSLLKMIAFKSDISKIYIRDPFDFLIIRFFLSRISDAKLIYDFRGISSEELALKKRSLWKINIMKKIESYIYKRADSICTVSNQLRNYLNERFGERHINVFPCLYSGSAVENDSRNEFSFCYVGGLSAWQSFDKVVNAFEVIYRMDERSSLTVCTNEVDLATSMLSSSSIPNHAYTVKSLPHEEVIKELSKHKYGFLLRDDNIVNKTSSPIKYFEYLSAGVIPILTPYVGDYSSFRAGIVIGRDISDDYSNFFNNNAASTVCYEEFEYHSFERYISNHPMNKSVAI